MTTTTIDTFVDGYCRFLETGRDEAGVMDQDLFFDVNVPHWRYQLQGKRVVQAELEASAPNGSRVSRGLVLPTPEGFVIELQELQDDHVGPGTIYRTVSLVKVEGSVITEVVMYCTGAWDQDTQARQAAEAPMIRR